MVSPAVATWYRCVRPHRGEHRPTTDVEPTARTVLAGGRHAANELQHLGDTAPVQAGDDLRLVQACGQQGAHSITRSQLESCLSLCQSSRYFSRRFANLCRQNNTTWVNPRAGARGGRSVADRGPGSDYHALDDVFARALARALAREHVLRERPEGRGSTFGARAAGLAPSKRCVAALINSFRRSFRRTAPCSM